MILVVNPNTAVDRVAVVNFREHATLRPERFSLWAGGSGTHAAYVASLLGADVLIQGFVGGHMGEKFRALLREQGLTAELVEIEDETRGTYSLLDAERGELCNIPEPGPRVSKAEEGALERLVLQRLPQAKLVVVSGSVPSGCSPDFPARIIAAARDAGIPCVADLAGEVLKLALPAKPWLIKPSLDELEEFKPHGAGSGDTLVKLAQEWVEIGVTNVCISLGADGLLWASATGLKRIMSPQVPAYNPIGCGDTLVGAAAACYAQAHDLEAALQVGVAAAAANVQYDAPGFCTPADIERLRSEVSIARLSGARQGRAGLGHAMRSEEQT